MNYFQALTFCVIGKIESCVEIVDQASGTDILPVVRVVLSGHGSEEEHDVVIPYDRDPFRTGRSLIPKGDLGETVEFHASTAVRKRLTRTRTHLPFWYGSRRKRH